MIRSPEYVGPPCANGRTIRTRRMIILCGAILKRKMSARIPLTLPRIGRGMRATGDGHVVAVLEDVQRPLSFEALERRLPMDAEQLDARLTSLQKAGRICYHAGEGGYALPTWTFDDVCGICGERIPNGEHVLVTIRHQRKDRSDTQTVRLHPACARE